MSTVLICPCCGNGYDEFYPGMSRKFKAYQMKIRRSERKRIQAALSAAAQEARSRTPGEGGNEDPWVGGVSAMLSEARRAVRR